MANNMADETLTPDWAADYFAVRPLNEPVVDDSDTWTHLVVFPITFGRGRVALANESSVGEHW